MNTIDYNHGLLNRVEGKQLNCYYSGQHGVHLIQQAKNKYVVIYLWTNYCNFWKRTFNGRREALMAYYDLLNDIDFRNKKAQEA